MERSEAGRPENILVVEDAEPVRKMVCSMLSSSGYLCKEAADGVEALGIIRASEPVDLILTDIMMPRMGGTELACRVAELRPDLPIVFMSGYSDDPVVRTLECSPALFLPKPFTATALNEKVRAALDNPWTGVPGAQITSAQ
jgi:CheY-like chemotaxis protein